MAVERPLSKADDFLAIKSSVRSHSLILTEPLVVKERRKVVPNHILDTKFFHQLSSNDVIQAEPASVHFSGFEPGKITKQTLRLVNTSSECQQMHIIPPATKYFKAWYKKKERLVPGLSMDVTVEFIPDEWRYYYDCIRIHCQDAENLIIPVHAYPVMDVTDFPKNYRFPPTPVSQSKTTEIPLKCKAPVDFEFNITFPQSHPAFTVEPTHGIVPANAETILRVTYSPTEFSTAIMKLQLNISQFNSKPLICVVTGSSAPGLLKNEVTSETVLLNGETTLDPRSISPLNLSRKNRSKKLVKLKEPPKQKTMEKDGVRFPSNLDAQHSVNSVLIQQAGKLSVRELREAMLAKKDSLVNRRQLKEAEFDQEVKEDVQAERRNQLRWQVHLGRDQISQRDKEAIVDERLEAVSDYHYRRGDPLPDIEYSRPCNSCIQRRTFRKVGEIPSNIAHFDLYSNDPWGLRHRAIGQFQKAVNKVILRIRAERKIPMIRKMVEDFKLGKVGKIITTTYGDDFQIAKYDDLPLQITSDKILTHSFPTYTSPDYKDDMAADSLGLVPSKPAALEVKREVPFFNLKVPHQYQLMGYTVHQAQEASSGYVPPKLIRPLRNGAEDEMINISVPEPAWTEEKQIDQDGIDADETLSLTKQPTAADLVPPAALFTPTEYPSLHIFNPAPGLQVFLPPMPYAETDPDFHLCPLPQYTHKDPTNKHGSTLKKFLDKEDIIKGVMQWKKFPSQGLVSLAHTPTLMNVWVPRWTDPFDTDLLPDGVPPLLDGLPGEDKINLNEEDDEEEDQEPESSFILSPAMVKAEFPSIEEPKTPEHHQSEREEFPFGTKLPAHNNPVSSTGPVPRKKREKELEMFLKKRNNKLGEKIKERVQHMNNLINNKGLILK